MYFVIILIHLNHLVSCFIEDEKKEINGSNGIKRDGEFTNRIVFTTTREDDPSLWFNDNYHQYEYIGQFWIGKTKYITAQISQKKTKEALSTLKEDPDINVLRQSSENDDVSPSMKIDEAWAAGYSGQGIIMAVLDDGLQTDHPDLAVNVDTDHDIDIYGFDHNPYPATGRSHGTEVSGLIGAVKDNNMCVVGVAFRCTLIGVRIAGTYALSDSEEAGGLNHYISNVDIYHNSWGPGDSSGFKGPGLLAREALQSGVTNGRNGKGVIFTWAAGNGQLSDNCNADGYVNSIYTVAITGVDNSKNAWYAEVCAPALAAAYGGSRDDRYLTTTTTASGCKSDGIQGTSYATAIASGIVALTLEANPNLTWRDIQHLIVFTSNRSGFNDTYSNWSINGANKEFSQVLGFGLMDAEAMVNYGTNWTTVPTQQNCTSATSFPDLSTNTSVSDSIHVTSGDCATINFLEHVVANISFSYSNMRGVTKLYLVSPSGTRSHLLHYREHDAVDNGTAGTQSWAFMSVHFWKETPNGIWTLEISSHNKSVTVTLNSWSLEFYGTSTDPWPTHFSSVVTTDTTTDVDTTTSTVTVTLYAVIFGSVGGTVGLLLIVAVVILIIKRTSISRNKQTNSESGPSYINEIPPDHQDLDMTIIDNMM
ncbi:FURIN [Mytilus edulis]|uniref:FURIN n=1 Tax=Mytilus edulis TaxID=6550 RepID=A0A8S3SGU7_MYTED|nr:FURIN [Mytilus edulis]